MGVGLRSRATALAFALRVAIAASAALLPASAAPDGSTPTASAATEGSAPTARAAEPLPGGAPAPLPGAAPFPPELAQRLARAAASRSPGAESRDGGGAPRYVNRLVLEASPYLLQHAFDPVDWYPWGDEAFARARREGKPVLLSIGYSSCHWCHVMGRESFEDVEIATALNRGYVAIKVDRELRPDVDSIYQAAARALGVSGGWPLTVWLTPERRPFHVATYLPPRAGATRSPVGFLDLLERLREVYRERPERVEAAAAALAQGLARASASAAADAEPAPGALARAYEQLAASFDATWGGFGPPPRFPHALELAFLLRYHRRTGEPHALEMVEATLAALAAGAIHDHVGGGFHRYATDRAWRAPHFEKMLYDNALIALVLLDAAQVTGRDDLAALARETLGQLERDMRSETGCFFAAIDADSEGVEGRYYTWTPEEIDRAAGTPRIGRLLRRTYGVGDATGPDARSALAIVRPLGEVATELGIPEAEAARMLELGRRRLLAARGERSPPHEDRKLVAAWNGLALSAFARAALVLRDPAFAASARRIGGCLRTQLALPSGDGRRARLRRAVTDGRSDGDGFLDDYAFAIAGLIDLFEATADPEWLRFALALQREQDARFWDADAGGYFLVASDQEQLLAREKPVLDAVEPSGNAIAVSNLLRLNLLTGEAPFLERAEATLRAFAGAIGRQPAAMPAMLAALDFHSDRAKEIVIVTPRPDEEPGALLDALARSFVPNRALAVVSEGPPLAELAALAPIVANKTARDGLPTAYLCERWVCKQPTTDPEEFARQLAVVEPLPASAPDAD